MRTNSYISAAALAAALLAFPQPGFAQDNGGLNLDLGGLGVDADIDLGGDNLLDVDAGIDVGGDIGVDAGVELGGTGSDDSLVDVDLDASSGAAGSDSLVDIDVGGDTGPNGGRLIDLDLFSDDAVPDAGDGGSSLVTGDVRIAALGDDGVRADALLGLIDSPDLADIDLDAAIDDRRVSILAAADLLGPDRLADIEAAIDAGGAGRDELQAALSASVELGSILDGEGIALDDVLAVQVADNGAAEVIVLGDTARLAALDDDGNLTGLSAGDLADLDVDLLSDDELAEVDVGLLPEAAATDVRVRLLADDDADDGAIDLADLSVADLADLDVDLLLGADSGSGNGGGDDGAGNGGSGNGGAGGSDGSGTGSGGNGGGSGGTGTGSDHDGSSDDGNVDTGAGVDMPVTGALPPAQVGASFGIAALGCNVGVLALANGLDASPQAIAGADSLELVRIDGCERSLVDADVDAIRSAIKVNPAISNVLDDASIPVEGVIGATIQGGTLTLFIDPVVS